MYFGCLDMYFELWTCINILGVWTCILGVWICLLAAGSLAGGLLLHDLQLLLLSCQLLILKLQLGRLCLELLLEKLVPVV